MFFHFFRKNQSQKIKKSNPRHIHNKADDFQIIAKLLYARKFIDNATNRRATFPVDCNYFIYLTPNEVFYNNHVEYPLKEICCAFGWMENKMNSDVKDVLGLPHQDATETA
jgi:hypothetical protein